MTSVAHIIRRRRNRKVRRRSERQRSGLWSLFIATLISLVILVPLAGTLGLAAVLYVRAVASMPTRAQTTNLEPIVGPTQLYDRDGTTLIYSVEDPLGDDRVWVNLGDLPPYVTQTTLQMEDPDFLESTSFDPVDTLGQLWRYILGGTVQRDTSLAGRLARNALVPLARSSDIDPVLLELVFSAELRRQFSPEEILEWHLNTNDYGNDAYGIDAAAQVYLGVRAVDLTLDETAILAAIPPAPQFNPFDNEDAARGRQLDLLRTLLSGGQIDQATFNAAASRLTPLRSDLLRAPLVAPTFAVYAREQAEDILDWIGLEGTRLVSRGGLRITTTLDLDLYNQSICTLDAHLAQLNGRPQPDDPACRGTLYLDDLIGIDPSNPPDQASMVLLDVASGELLSMVGPALARDTQPGPVLRPFVYLNGFLNGLTPATMVLDIPQPYPGPAQGLVYTPRNADGQYRGPLNLRDAMASGLLTPSVYVANQQRMSSTLRIMQQMGIANLSQDANDLALLERGGSVSLLDITFSYSIFADMGVMQGVDVLPSSPGGRARDPVAILSIEDADGEILWSYDQDRRALSRTRILAADLSYLVNDILADDNARRSLGLEVPPLAPGRPAALAKGLTGDRSESWAIGYTPQLVAGVHLSRSDGQALSLDVNGLRGAEPLWRAVLRYAHERAGYAPAVWPRPAGIQEFIVCKRSGLTPPPGINCQQYSELHLAQVPPTQEDPYWVSVQVNSQTGQLATPQTPPTLVETREYFVPPAVAQEWWRLANLPLPPTEYDLVSRSELVQGAELLLPTDFAYVGGQVAVRGNIDTAGMTAYQVSYGQGLSPAQWFTIGERQTAVAPGGDLATWDTSGLDGFYTLELAVTYEDGTRDTDYVGVTVDNTAPIVSLQAGEPGQIFRFPTDSVIPLLANVEDNLALDRVEFYRNGILYATDIEWPYGLQFEVERAGREIFRAVAYDEVGNFSEAEITVEVQRSS